AIVGQYAAVIAIDDGQVAVAIAIGIVRILHQVRLLRARLIVIVTHAAIRQLLGDALIAIVAAPNHRLLVVIVISVVGGRIAERLPHRIGAIQIGITVITRRGIAHRRGGRQGGRRRRGLGGGRRALRQRQRRQRRWRGGRFGLSIGIAGGIFLAALVVA